MQTSQYGFLDNRNLIGLWDQLYEPALGQTWARQIGTMVDSNMEVESYGWLGAAPALELMTADNPSEEQLKKWTYYLRNQEYAKALKFAEKDMRRDKLGQIQMRIGEMTEKAAEHWNVLSAQTLIANPNGYDAVPLFSTAHPESGTSQVNDVSATQIPALNVADSSNIPTPAEAASALNAIIGQFYTFVDDKNYPMNGQAKSFTVLTGNQNIWGPLNYAATATTFAGGQTNQLQGLYQKGISIDVVMTPLLNSSSYFYVFRNDSRIKALMLQSEIDIEPLASDRSNDEYIKFRRFLFSIYASRAVGVARWQSSIRATFS